jgi:hypothetical protein
VLIKTLLNRVERFKSFVYDATQVMLVDGVEALVIDIEARRIETYRFKSPCEFRQSLRGPCLPIKGCIFREEGRCPRRP